MTDDTYVVQLFSNFAPPESNPLLMRLSSTATFAEASTQALAKFAERHPIGVFLPSEEAEDYRIYAAGGDGYPDPLQRDAYAPERAVRSTGVQFPYMFTIIYRPRVVSADGTEGSAVSQSNASQNATGGPATIKSMSQAEKAAAAARRKEVEARREENLRMIERNRIEQERAHYQHCESHEIARREEARLKKEAADAIAKRAAVEQGIDVPRQEVLQDREKERERSLLDQHREEVQSQLQAERDERNRMAEARERRIADALRAKEEAKELRKQEAVKERDSRMKSAMHNLIAGLDSSAGVEATGTDARLLRERQQRLGAQQAALERRRVAQLEEKRNASKRDVRDVRVTKQAAEHDRRSREQTLLEESAMLEDVAERERYLAWQASRQSALDAYRDEQELVYRSRIEESRISHAPSGEVSAVQPL